MRLAFVLCFVVVPVWCELIRTGLAIGASFSFASVFAWFDYFKCNWYECCKDEYIPTNVTGLKEALNQRLYGQHLVIDTVVKAIRGHTSNRNPEKALVMSFHGWTGGGKNYVSSIIAEHLYKKGMQSNYVHLFIAKLHFPHASEIDRDKTLLQNWIRGNVSRCERSLFIFDELDEMNAGILEAVKPFIDYHANVDGVDYRKTIFIFLSNTAGHDIYEKALDHWRQGKPRETLTLAEMEKVIHVPAFNEPGWWGWWIAHAANVLQHIGLTVGRQDNQGALKFSQLISSNLIDHFVPFLPLERDHVKLCIRDYFRWRGISDPGDDRVRRVADMLQYFPKTEQVYSSSGCKRVSQKINLILEEEDDQEQTGRRRITEL